MLSPYDADLLDPFYNTMPSTMQMAPFFSPLRHRPWSRQLASMETGMRDMDRDFDRLERQLTSSLGIEPAALPRIEPRIVKDGDQQKYLVNLNMGRDFTPQNLKVAIRNNIVTVDAKKEEVSEDGHHRRFQEVTRRFTLPQGVSPQQVKSHLDANGVLRIEAPLSQAALAAPQAPQPISIEY